ncbi:MAG: hypothetical protein C0507_24210 [Cyanobacteria bacterium PR.3.49]|nr:hypothetical protein [Cyanobacteria bacterium PR.3.49]
MSQSEHIYDCVIVGGGPAGVSCALECHESALDVVVLEREERVGGQLPLIPSPIFNYVAGYFENGEMARNELEKVAKLFLGERLLTNCNVQSVDLTKKQILTNRGNFRGRTIFLATGYRLKQWDFPVPERFAGDVLYRSGIVRDQLRGKPIAIIGGGDSAVFTALDLAGHDCPVTVLARSEKFKARPDIVDSMYRHENITVHTGTIVKHMDGGPKLERIVTENSKGDIEVTCEKVIAKLGYVPNTELFADQLVTLQGHIKVNENQATSLEAVFAGGDIVMPGYDRVAFAAGTGMMAARSIRCYLGQTP